jgi:NAD(P)-dependent dehydrogenase (short-subunit alcohol dehydrogenase family)
MAVTERRSFVVSGASTGIGRACVDELVHNGFQVWATVRTDEDEAALSRDHPDTVTVLRLDLTDPASILAAGERVCAAGPVHGLVNNAGVALPGPLEYLPVDVFRRQIEINLVGQLAVTQAVMPALRQAREQGETARIVMIGSIGGRIAGPMLGPYHASKFGLVGLSDGLRAELAPFGIRVVLIEPGSIATPIWSRGATAADQLVEQLPTEGRDRYAAQIAGVRTSTAKSAARGLPPQRVARVVVTALTTRKPRPRYLIGPDAHAAALVARLPFALRYRLTAARS